MGTAAILLFLSHLAIASLNYPGLLAVDVAESGIDASPLCASAKCTPPVRHTGQGAKHQPYSPIKLEGESKSGPSFNCANIQTSVESAICGDRELSRLDRLTDQSYKRLQADHAVSNAAFQVLMDLTRARAACITWTPGEQFKKCIRKRQLAALRQYRKLEHQAKRR